MTNELDGKARSAAALARVNAEKAAAKSAAKVAEDEKRKTAEQSKDLDEVGAVDSILGGDILKMDIL